MMTNDLDIDLYEQRGIQPPWQTLQPCGSQPSLNAEIEADCKEYTEMYNEDMAADNEDAK